MRSFGEHTEFHGFAGTMRQFVFGMEDGIVSTTGAVIGIAAGTRNAEIVILSGVVIILVEALSMAAGEYLSSKSEREYLEKKIREEEIEIETKPEHEREELAEMYRERGFNEEEIEILVRRITADKDLWLEEMMAKELRIGKGELDETKGGAIIMWITYTIGGAIPLTPFFFLDIPTAMVSSFVLGASALFLLGYWKAQVSGINRLKSGVEMLAIAAGAGVIGYVAGMYIGEFFGIVV